MGRKRTTPRVPLELFTQIVNHIAAGKTLSVHYESHATAVAARNDFTKWRLAEEQKILAEDWRRALNSVSISIHRIKSKDENVPDAAIMSIKPRAHSTTYAPLAAFFHSSEQSPGEQSITLADSPEDELFNLPSSE